MGQSFPKIRLTSDRNALSEKSCQLSAKSKATTDYGLQTTDFRKTVGRMQLRAKRIAHGAKRKALRAINCRFTQTGKDNLNAI